MTSAASLSGVYVSAHIPRFLLSAAAAGGADAGRLARDARLPRWALAQDQAMVSTRHALRLWELTEHAIQNPSLPLIVSSRHHLGEVGLYDYLYSTAATLRDGLRACSRYMQLITNNGLLKIETRTERETTYSFSHIAAAGRGAELALQFAVAMFCARAQAATGRPVVPVRVGFAQPPPRSHRALAETLGTRRIDFGAPTATFTLQAADLDLPMRGADPLLARILRRYAASVPPPALAAWHEHFRRQLSDMIECGAPSLEAMARHMAISTRTLQRQLAEHGTTWRAELDAARRRHAQQARQAGPPSMTRLARELGFADARSARRAVRRWDMAQAGPGELALWDPGAGLVPRPARGKRGGQGQKAGAQGPLVSYPVLFFRGGVLQH
jgi:AraC-like DNA-binding protein